VIRAALFDGPGRPFRIATLPRPALSPGECLVRTTLATVCGSDRHTVAGKRTAATPCVLGHEAVGVIDEIAGSIRSVDGQPLRVGDRVVWSVAVHCGSCFFCTHGLPQKCVSLRKYGKEAADPQRGPSGCFASHVHLWPGTPIVRIPDSVPDAVAAPAMCAAATVAAALRVGGGIPSEGSVIVTGAGMLGLTAAAMCFKSNRAIVDREPQRLAAAAAFGNPHPIRWPEDAEQLATLAPRGFDLALELTGANPMAELAVNSVRIGGTVVLAGAVYPTGNLSIDHQRIVRECMTIRGIHNYAPEDLVTAVNFLAAHQLQFPFAEMVAAPQSLERIDEVFADATPVRASIVPDR
jgi:putative phosphonate catabolism associated alcohol dehydrogenase